MELWRGDLLSGLDDDWVLVARDEWRQKVGERARRARDPGRETPATCKPLSPTPVGSSRSTRSARRLSAHSCPGSQRPGIAPPRSSRTTDMQIGSAPSCGSRPRRPRERSPRSCAARVPSDRVGGPRACRTRSPRQLRRQGPLTLLFTDLVGSTELLDDLGDDQAAQLRRVHFGLLREVALSHAGREVKNLGDGLMVAFASSLDAAACAIAIQQPSSGRNRREESVSLQRPDRPARGRADPRRGRLLRHLGGRGQAVCATARTAARFSPPSSCDC